MAQIPKGRFEKGPYKPIYWDCAIYFSSTVTSFGLVRVFPNFPTSPIPKHHPRGFGLIPEKYHQCLGLMVKTERNHEDGSFVGTFGCFQTYGYPKMDGENNGKPLLKWDDLGVSLFSETSIFKDYV